MGEPCERASTSTDGWPLYLARYVALTRDEQDSRMSRTDLMALAEEERSDLWRCSAV